MTDNQFYMLISVLGAGLAGIGAAIRFSVGRVVRALDVNSTAMLENTKSNAILSTKIDAIGSYVQRRSGVPSDVKEFLAGAVAEAVEKEISGVHDVAPSPSNDVTPNLRPVRPARAATAPGAGEYKRGRGDKA